MILILVLHLSPGASRYRGPCVGGIAAPFTEVPALTTITKNFFQTNKNRDCRG